MLVLAKLTDNLSGLLLVLVALTAIALLVRTNRYFARRRREPPWQGYAQQPRQEDTPSPADAPGDVAGWEVQMHEMARAMSGQLDSKMSGLQALIAEADRAAARLEAAMVKNREASPPPPGSQAEGLRLPTPAGGNLAAPAEVQDRSHRREEIYTLADYGYDAAEIARRVGSPIGEVELTLSLRGKGRG
jgi:hypothetical protein